MEIKFLVTLQLHKINAMNNNVTSLPSLAILAGGLATRLGNVSKKVPKALLRVGGKPFIAHQLRLAQQQGINKVVLCVGYLGSDIEAYVGDGDRFGLRVSYSYDGPVLLGTGGALKKAVTKLPEVFLIMYGDSYLNTSYRRVAKQFYLSGKLGLMTVFRNANQWDKSNVEFWKDIVIQYDKKDPNPDMKFIDYGLSVLKSKALDSWAPNEPFDLVEVYQHLIGLGELAGYEVPERFYEIGSPEGLAETDHYLAEKRGTDVIR